MNGAGLRVVVGERTGYAYSEGLREDALLEAADAAALIVRDAIGSPSNGALRRRVAPKLYSPRVRETDATQYVDLLVRADVAARSYDHRIANVSAFVIDEFQQVEIAGSDGWITADQRPLTMLGVQVVAKDKERRESAFAADGARGSIECFARRTPESIAVEAARIVSVKLRAGIAPTGEMPVVIGPGGGGVFVHEAIGHALEGDVVRKGSSSYSGLLGQRVASDLVTIIDDGSLVDERGSVAVDDEGEPGRSNVLIENGILRGYMADRQTAMLLGVPATGSGRRESFRVPPLPRMCNTYMASGTCRAEEVIGTVDRGLYAASFSGGHADVRSGDFAFVVSEAYLIERGKLTAPVRGATLVGNGPTALRAISLVAGDGRLASRSYTCGKAGQRLPVGVGSPTVRLDSCVVGGTS